MSDEELKKGSTYSGQKDITPSGYIEHLRFVISDFVYDDIMQTECAFVVNMTSSHDASFEDDSCILTPTDHPRVEHKSYIAYQYAQRLPKSFILDQIAKGEFIPREDMSDTLLRKIQQGAIDSDDTPEFVDFYKEYF